MKATIDIERKNYTYESDLVEEYVIFKIYDCGFILYFISVSFRQLCIIAIIKQKEKRREYI